MSTYETSYCNTTTDLLFVEPNISQYDGKAVLPANWVASGTSNLYYLHNSGYVSQLYKDGEEQTSVTDTPNANNEFEYDSGSDRTQVFMGGLSVSAMNSTVFESSRDWATLKTEAVKRASDFIRGYLPFPVYPNKGIGTADAVGNDFPEIIVRSTAIMAVESLIRPYDVEKADEIRSQAINELGTGYLDMLRTGQVHLYSSESEYKKRGILRTISVHANTTGGIVDVKGTPSYEWDKIKIIISNGGTITEGSANSTVKFNSFVGNQDGIKLEKQTDDEVIDCYWQPVGHNMKIRWSAGLYTTNDEYELEVSGVLDQRMTPIKRVQMTRI